MQFIEVFDVGNMIKLLNMMTLVALIAGIAFGYYLAKYMDSQKEGGAVSAKPCCSKE